MQDHSHDHDHSKDRAQHDIGGVEEVYSNDGIYSKDPSYNPPHTHFDKSIHALLILLGTKKPYPLMTTDEFRRAQEVCMNMSSLTLMDTDVYVLVIYRT